MTYIFPIEQVARQFGLTIAACDRQSMHRLVLNAAIAGIITANANADVDDACSDAAASA